MLCDLPKLKKTGQRNTASYVVSPPQRSKGIIQALNTNSSVTGACFMDNHYLLQIKKVISRFSHCLPDRNLTKKNYRKYLMTVIQVKKSIN